MKRPSPLRKRLRRLSRDLTGHSKADMTFLLIAQIDAALAGAATAHEAASGVMRSSDARDRMADIEHEGDAARGELVTAVSVALVPPLDPEDMFRLSRSIDDVLDDLRDFVRELDLFDAADAQFASLIECIREGLLMLRAAVEGIVTDPRRVTERILAAKKSCNAVRREFGEQMCVLLDGAVTVGMLRRRELLLRLDGVGLRLGESVDALADAAIKRTL